MTAETFVIVGASLAGGKAAETLREEGFDGRLVLIGAETEPPYERPPLSKGYLTGADERSVAFLHEPAWYAEHEIDGARAPRPLRLDLQTRTLALHPTDTLSYDRLLHRNRFGGAHPRHPGIRSGRCAVPAHPGPG